MDSLEGNPVDNTGKVHGADTDTPPRCVKPHGDEPPNIELDSSGTISKEETKADTSIIQGSSPASTDQSLSTRLSVTQISLVDKVLGAASALRTTTQANPPKPNMDDIGVMEAGPQHNVEAAPQISGVTNTPPGVYFMDPLALQLGSKDGVISKLLQQTAMKTPKDITPCHTSTDTPVTPANFLNVMMTTADNKPVTVYLQAAEPAKFLPAAAPRTIAPKQTTSHPSSTQVVESTAQSPVTQAQLSTSAVNTSQPTNSGTLEPSATSMETINGVAVHLHNNKASTLSAVTVKEEPMNIEGEIIEEESQEPAAERMSVTEEPTRTGFGEQGCVAKYCSSTLYTFKWPDAKKYPKDHACWTNWCRTDRSSFSYKESYRLCWKHFDEDDFTNTMPFKRGFNTSLRLNKGAVPRTRFKSQEDADNSPRDPHETFDKPLLPRERRKIIRQTLLENSDEYKRRNKEVEEAKRQKQEHDAWKAKEAAKEAAKTAKLKKKRPPPTFIDNIIDEVDKQTERKIEQLKSNAAYIKARLSSLRDGKPMKPSLPGVTNMEEDFKDFEFYSTGPKSLKEMKVILKYSTSDMTNLPLLLIAPVPKSIKFIKDYVCESAVNCAMFTSQGNLILGCHEGIYLYDTIFDLCGCTSVSNVTAVANANNRIYYMKCEGEDPEDSTVSVCSTDELLAQHSVLAVLPGEAERYCLAVNNQFICVTDSTVNTISFYDLEGVGLWTKFLSYAPGAVCTSHIDWAVLISDPDNNLVHKYSVDMKSQEFEEVWQCEGDWAAPTELCMDPSGVVYVKGTYSRQHGHKAINVVSMEGRYAGSLSGQCTFDHRSNISVYKDRLVTPRYNTNFFRVTKIKF